MKSIDALLDKTYNPESYHCVHFVIDAGKYLFGYDFSNNFLGLNHSLISNGSPSRHTVSQSIRTATPMDGSVVLMNKLDNSLHVGLYLDGRVLHLSETGVRYELIHSLQRYYKRIRYYNAKNFHKST